MPHFYRAVSINPDDPDSNLNIGGYEQRQKNLPQAIAQYNKVISATQESAVVNADVRAKAFDNMGYCYRELGDLDRTPGRALKPQWPPTPNWRKHGSAWGWSIKRPAMSARRFRRIPRP